ncbi:hypothetical protein AB7M47_000240 [Bradyrhizobium elkanii]
MIDEDQPQREPAEQIEAELALAGRRQSDRGRSNLRLGLSLYFGLGRQPPANRLWGRQSSSSNTVSAADAPHAVLKR